MQLMFSLATVATLTGLSLTSAYDIPCYLPGSTDANPAGCVNRVQSCGYYANNPPSVSIDHTIGVNDDTNCGDDRANNNNHPPIRRGYWYVVQWDDRYNNCYEILMQAGECWGEYYRNDAGEVMNYRCQGRCGNGCEGEGVAAVCSNWARDCLKHDVCRYFHPNNGGGSDIDCGDEYDDAYDDFTACCAGSYWWNKWLCNRCELYDSNRNNLQDSSSCSNP